MILPFSGIRLSADLARREPSLCLPYDCLTQEMEKRCRSRAHNAIHLEEPRPSLGQAHQLWLRWRQNGALAVDSPAYYYLVERYAGGLRSGILGLLDLSRHRYVWPHERTFLKFINQRKRHIEGVKVQLSPLFLIAEDRQGRLAHLLRMLFSRKSSLPAAGFFKAGACDGAERALYGAAAQPWLNRLRQALEPDGGYLVADGHHRYQAALKLFKQGRLNHALCYVTSAKLGAALLREHHPVPGLSKKEQDSALRKKLWTLAQVIERAKKGALLPKKTTYFYPKIPCGLVYYEGR